MKDVGISQAVAVRGSSVEQMAATVAKSEPQVPVDGAVSALASIAMKAERDFAMVRPMPGMVAPGLIGAPAHPGIGIAPGGCFPPRPPIGMPGFPSFPSFPGLPTIPTMPGPVGPSLSDQAEKAAGALGAYMHSTGTKTMDPNKLYALMNDKSGKISPEVQQAAGFMLAHPNVYKKIETNDVKGADGISGAGNFDQAAQGLIDVTPRRVHGAPTAPLEDRAEKAAGTLAAYMQSEGKTAIDVNDLYALSNNAGGKVPPDVRQAARLLLANPEIYKKIETNDVAGADGICGLGNLQNAAMGKIDLVKNEPVRPMDPFDDIQSIQDYSAELMKMFQMLAQCLMGAQGGLLHRPLPQPITNMPML